MSTFELFLFGLAFALALAVYAMSRRARTAASARDAEWEARLRAESERATEAGRRLDSQRDESARALAAAHAEAERTELELRADAERSLAAAADDARGLQSLLGAERERIRALTAEIERGDEERAALSRALDAARAECAEYRQILVDVENHSPPPILSGAVDDLKLIVGVGPVLERLLHKIGVTTFRQIAGWTDADIAAFDVKLEEFHGRVRRDDWVTQARELHYQKYGERLARPVGEPS